jgi:hypothetical protein
MIKEGVYSRGAVALGISGDIDVEEACAQGARRNPRHVAKEI